MRDPLKSKSDKPVILQRPGHRIFRQDIDRDALKVLDRLKRLGFTAYLTGAAVQNLLSGIVPKDFDIVTDARPGQIKRRFSNTYLIGRRFRLAHIHFKNGKFIEVATFRRDPDLPNKENPETAAKWKNTYGTPREDAFRRDITINALFYDVSTASVIDYVGGLKDLKKKKDQDYWRSCSTLYGGPCPHAAGCQTCSPPGIRQRKEIKTRYPYASWPS